MTVNISNTLTTNTFEYWRNRTNELAFAASARNVTVNSNTALGNASVSRTFSANVLTANSTVTASNTTTGALIVSGGTGIQGTVHVGNTLTVAGLATFNAGAAINNDVTMSANINFNDDEAATFGTSQDLSIHHDGSHSYVTDSGTGDLRVRTSVLALQNTDGSGAYATFTSGGAAQIYFNGSEKIATTTTGVDVTGEANTTTLKVNSSSDFNGNVVITAPANFQFDDMATANNKFLRVNSTGTGVQYSNVSVEQLDEIQDVVINYGSLANAHVIVYDADTGNWVNRSRSLIDPTQISDLDNVNGANTGQILVKVTGGTFTGTSNGFVAGKLNSFSEQTFTSQTGNTLSFTSTAESVVQVFVNGVKYVGSGTDFSTNTTSINMLSNFDTADIIEVVHWNPNAFTVTDGTVTDSSHSSY